MTKRTTTKSLILLSGTILILAVLFCSRDLSTGSSGKSFIAPSVLWKAGAVTVAPDSVNFVRITVTASSLTSPVVKTAPYSDHWITFDAIPHNSTVTILVEGLDRDSVVLFSGAKTETVGTQDTVAIIIEASIVTPVAPDSLQAFVRAYDVVFLQWKDRSRNETKFIIERSAGAAVFDTLKLIVDNETTYVDTGLSPSTQYRYRVYSVNQAGISLSPSDTAVAATPAIPVNHAPQFLASLRTTLAADTLLFTVSRFARLLIATDQDSDQVSYSASSPFMVNTSDSVYWTPTDTGTRSAWVKVVDEHGLSDSIGWQVHIGTITNVTVQPQSQSVTAASQATFSMAAAGISLQYQWQKNDTNISGATLSSYTTPATVLADSGAKYRCVVAGTYGRDTTDVCTLFVVTTITVPVVTTSPSAKSATEGLTATFSVIASGVNLNYQWQKNDSNITGATNANYTTPALLLSSTGAWYRCIVRNTAGSDTSDSAQLTVTPRMTAPQVTTQPSSRSVTLGQTATFTLVASSDSLTYKWQKNHVEITGANAATYTTPATVQADSGKWFRCIVQNSAGKDTSDSVMLAVTQSVVAPSITLQPVGKSVITGQTATFTLTATGTSLVYLWQKNKIDIAGSNAASYTTPATSLSDNNVWFRCIVSNVARADTSDSVKLAVTAAAGLVAYYPFTGNANDASGNGYNGTVVGATLSTDRYNASDAAYSFDGSSYIDFGDHFNPDSTSLCISFWFKTSQMTRWDIDKRTGDGMDAFGIHAVFNLFPADPKPHMFRVGDDFCQFNMNASDNKWHFLSLMRNITTKKLQVYADGVLAAETTAVIQNIQNVAHFEVGKNFANSFYYAGNIDDIRIYNRALSTTEIDSLYQEGGWNGYPVISIQPQPQSKTVGQTAQFTVTATGTALTYQWKKNGVNIGGANGATYTTPALTITDNYAYFKCAVSSGTATVVSDSAKLTVTAPTGLSLAAYYPFDGNANDASGNGFNGTVSGASLVADRFGVSSKAYSFNGSSSYINVGNPLGVTTKISVSFWLKTSNASRGAAIGKKPTGTWNSGYWVLDKFPDSLGYINNGVECWTRSLSLDSTKWYHYCLVQTDTSMQMYVNGIQKQVISYTPTAQSSSNIWIGAREDVVHNYLSGCIDDVSFYNGTLTPSQVDSLYKIGGWTGNSSTGMKLINSGTFQMGQVGVTDAVPVHAVTVSSFFMDSTEVTQADYLALMGVNPSGFTGDTRRPVENISWFDAALYSNRRSNRDGLDTVYKYTSITGESGNQSTALVGLVIDLTKNGYRLPTEAEWEFACRASSTSTYSWGTDTMDGRYTWNAANSGGTTHPVATKLPNLWGLFDMSGNVLEWCNDWFNATYYSSSPASNPPGPSSGTYRSTRGGSWQSPNTYHRSAGRDWIAPNGPANYYGFRVVRPQ